MKNDEINNRKQGKPAYDPDFDEPFTGGPDNFDPDDFSGEGPDLDDFSGEGPDLDDLDDAGTYGTSKNSNASAAGDLDLDDDEERQQSTSGSNYVSGNNMGGTGRTAAGSAGNGRDRRSPRELNTAGTAVNAKQLKDEKEKKKKSKVKKIIGWVVLEIITLAAIFTYGYFLRSWNLISRPEVNAENIENNNISLEKKKQMEQGYWTFAVFGVDGRNAGDLVSKGLNSDVILIVNVNQDTGEIRMCNVFRDTYLNISDDNLYRKINAAYCNGGPEQALSALNKNLDLNIKNYVTFNWKAVADGINILGGVDDIDISKAEFYYINAFITETVEVTGIGSHHLKAPGTHHLDGVQAVAYGRLRLMDTDFARTERQKKIIKACFEKAKQSSFSVLNNIMVVCFPEVATNIDFNTVVEIAKDVTKYNITQTGGFPWQRSGSAVSSTGDVVVPATLESNVKYLHKFLFDDEDYQPSDAVLRYSETIKEKTGIYKEGQVVEYVRTDGGLISTPKTTEAATEESLGDAEPETDENGNTVERPTIGLDGDGKYVYPTDAEGNIVLPTDAGGNIQYPTDEYGNIIYETDAEGNTVNPTDAEGNELTYPETRPSELSENGEEGPGESSHGNDADEAAGPGAQTGTTKSSKNTDAPGSGTRTTTEAYGPGNTGAATESSTAQQVDRPDETVSGSSTPGGTVSGSSTPGGTGGPGSSTTETTGSSTPGGSSTGGQSTGPVLESTASGSLTPGGTGGPGSTTTETTGSNAPGSAPG